jgi:hypothetical protein
VYWRRRLQTNLWTRKGASISWEAKAFLIFQHTSRFRIQRPARLLTQIQQRDFLSTNLTDYTYLDPNVRAFSFSLAGGSYNLARVFVTDNGDSGDAIRVQLFSNGFLVYDSVGFVTSDCGPGITITPDTTTPPPEPEPKPKHEPKPRRPKGNNGVGNGIDPQPPGNPPINDGPGTGPGNPGNRQLGGRK